MASFSTPADGLGRGKLSYALAVLFGLNFMNFYDRQVIGAVGEKIKAEWQLSDGQLGSLTTAFVLLYALVGIPFGRLADTGTRRLVLSRGVAVWSAFTALSGAAGSFVTHFLCRMGVGVGEASLAPTANSLIADLFPPARRARAISVFMLGLPLGLGASYLISGLIAQATGGWRPALYVAAAPGFVLAILALFITEPPRTASSVPDGARHESTAQSIRAILQIPTMWWIIASGALMNLVMYSVGAFSTSFYIRYHGLDIDYANRYNALVFGVGGGIGIVVGGWFGDRAGRRGPSGRLQLATLGSLIAAPMLWLALEQIRGDARGFAGYLFVAVLAIYLYYSTVYAAIHDLVPASRRGMAMSVYFFVFYIFTAIGLVLFGRLSDAMAARALATGVSAAESRALGLHDAMYVMPLFCAALVVVLYVASRTAVRDIKRVALLAT
ncbi:MAG: MFS transporter [Gemmatimonadaceae bacterium]|nr:MFS transporter [Gemmatimonadaceae bacterium]